MADTSRPSYSTEPCTTAPSGSSRVTVRTVIDFPDPDSPTRPSASPDATDRLSSLSTGRKRPPTLSDTSTSRSSSTPRPPPQRMTFRALAGDPGAQDGQRQHAAHDEHSRQDHRQQVALLHGVGVADHDAPVGGRGLDREAEVG